jgi:hypothetical protein
MRSDEESLYLNVRASLESCGLGIFFGARTCSGELAAADRGLSASAFPPRDHSVLRCLRACWQILRLVIGSARHRPIRSRRRSNRAKRVLHLRQTSSGGRDLCMPTTISPAPGRRLGCISVYFREKCVAKVTAPGISGLLMLADVRLPSAKSGISTH